MNVIESAILVPVDTSSLSERALPIAASLATALDLPIQLLAVVDNVVANAVTEFADREGIGIYDAVDAYFERLIADLADSGIEVAFHAEPHIHAADGILQFVEDHEIVMIVMASHGNSGLTRWLLGSIAEKVVRSANVPVTIVPVREA